MVLIIRRVFGALPLTSSRLGIPLPKVTALRRDKSFISAIRRRHPGTLNLGIGGNGPLVMLATIREYAQIVKPKVVLWFYFEGNDLADLGNERKNPVLSQYLTNNEFSQGLFNRQAEIDRALVAYLESVPKTNWSIKLQEISGTD